MNYLRIHIQALFKSKCLGTSKKMGLTQNIIKIAAQQPGFEMEHTIFLSISIKSQKEK
jgi:hypothetical protein